MRISWRLPLLLSACVVAGQLFHLAPLADALTGATPAQLRLVYPAGHVLLAPFTLLADWLNGSPARELKGVVVWAALAFALARLARRRPGGRSPVRGILREALATTLFLAALAAFVAWGAFAPRPIPRLAADDPDLLVFDLHSHTDASHDGRPGFGPTENAAWHARAGFDATFITDHNTTVALRPRYPAAAPPGFRILPGIELSLNGLHLLALGTAREIPVAPYRDRWDATGTLIRALAGGDRAAASAPAAAPPRGSVATLPAVRPFLVASLPEYWEHHWGADLDSLVSWGVGGLEVWTTSPRAMGFPPVLRGEVAARARREGLALFAATDMHGVGFTASAWNVTRVRGWRRLDAVPLTAVLLAKFRREGADASEPVVLRRWLPETPLQAAVAVPLNVVLLLRTASPAHGAALLGWIWLPALLLSARRRTPRP